IETTTSSVKDSSFVEKMKKTGRNIIVFYGSQTGTAEEFANRLSKDAHRYGMRGMAADPEEYDLSDLSSLPEIENALAVFCMATYGEGDPTDNAQDFYDWLQEADVDLSGVKYAVFGLGDKTYEHFNAMDTAVVYTGEMGRLKSYENQKPPFDAKNPFLAVVTTNRKLNQGTERHLMMASSSGEGKELYLSWVVEARRHILAILQDYPSLRPPIDHLCERYQIASSSKVHPNSVHICAYETKSGRVNKGRAKEEPAGEDGRRALVMFVRKSQFRLPFKATTPVIMVGPGTGVAPFIGFIQERAWLQEQGKEVGETLLYYGCRRYICGDARNMARDVQNTFCDIVAEQGPPMEHAQAVDYVKKLMTKGRYSLDVWSSLNNLDEESNKRHPFPCPTTYRTALTYYLDITDPPRTNVLYELAQYASERKMGKYVDKRLEQLGAQRIFDLGLGDDDTEEFWREQFWPAVCEHFGVEATGEESSIRQYELVVHTDM
nr:reductase,NADPH cytochrome P450 [Sus scrofa domesticus]